MASSNMMIILAFVAVLVPTIFATEFTVGDSSGWTNNFNYQTWAAGKTFYVGDKLVFKYAVGVHNVNKVNQTAFEACQIPLSGALETGNDVITLATSGKKWYICGKGKHCELGGQKLAITVLDAAPAAAPSAAASTRVCGWIATASSVLLMKYLI